MKIVVPVIAVAAVLLLVAIISVGMYCLLLCA